MRRISFLLLGLSALLSLHAQSLKVTVTNPSDFQRQQVVEISLQKVQQQMNIDAEAPLCVKNALGQVVTSQITHDGKLLFESAVHPHGLSEFTLEAISTPMKEGKSAFGFVAKTRKDDLSWENDRSSYRVYGPPLRRTGEKAYGVDVWTKSTPHLVNTDRYRIDHEGNIVKDSLRRMKKDDEWKTVDLATSFHLDHGDGLDCYGVGPSLGCGAPALFLKNQLLMPWCYETVNILDNGPLRFTAEFVFGSANNESLSTLLSSLSPIKQHRIISLDKGSNYNRCEVWYDEIPSEAALAAGIVIHKADTTSLKMTSSSILYADPTDRPQKLGTQLYVGVLFPDAVESTTFLHDPQGDIVGNAIGMKTYSAGQHFVYYFGSAWSAADVRSFREWQLRSEEYLEALKAPLKVTLVKE